MVHNGVFWYGVESVPDIILHKLGRCKFRFENPVGCKIFGTILDML